MICYTSPYSAAAALPTTTRFREVGVCRLTLWFISTLSIPDPRSKNYQHSADSYVGFRLNFLSVFGLQLDRDMGQITHWLALL